MNRKALNSRIINQLFYDVFKNQGFTRVRINVDEFRDELNERTSEFFKGEAQDGFMISYPDKDKDTAVLSRALDKEPDVDDAGPSYWLKTCPNGEVILVLPPCLAKEVHPSLFPDALSTEMAEMIVSAVHKELLPRTIHVMIPQIEQSILEPHMVLKYCSRTAEITPGIAGGAESEPIFYDSKAKLGIAVGALSWLSAALIPGRSVHTHEESRRYLALQHLSDIKSCGYFTMATLSELISSISVDGETPSISALTSKVRTWMSDVFNKDQLSDKFEKQLAEAFSITPSRPPRA